jgi:diguanylate cyclase (GGDEF)-like protein
MLASVLLIDATGGRIETHFHIFGSLAFLAFYRDWRVLLTASLVTSADHLIAGLWWPQSIYGVPTVSPWRWMEHSWWVAFEDIFLFVLCQQSLHDVWTIAVKEARMAFGAGHDVLTGLANRRLLEERFSPALPAPALSGSDSVQKAVLFIDLDRFKQVNDTLGHTTGDKLLAKVAERLASSVRSTDTVARIGGDEFVVLIENADEGKATRIAGELLDAFNRPFEIDGAQLFISASVGISLAPEHGEELATLQEAADKAMYEAKSRGRNRFVVYSGAVFQREKTATILRRDIYHALARRELQVYFQPQVDRGGHLIGFEALMRWEHPSLGMVLPSAFIPIAEETGLILSMGQWILREACKSCGEWQEQGFAGLRVAINASAPEFEQSDYAEQVARVVAEVGLNPSLLTIEITETVLLNNIPLVLRHLDRIRQTGVEISLDDFGTGYSSLTYLQELNADSVKLDHSFVTRALDHNVTMLESVIAMAHRNGLEVTGEGIETQEQSRLLGMIGCDILQGYYYGEPMAAGNVASFIEAFAGVKAMAARESEPADAAYATEVNAA